MMGVSLTATVACSSAAPPKPVDPGEPPVCRMATTMGANKPLGDRALPPAFWFSLILKDYQASGAVTRPVRDCEGQVANWNVDGCGNEPDVEAIPSPALTDRDIVVSHLGEGRRLVWVLADRFVNGEGAGPVAMAEFDDRGVSVTTLGILRAYASRAQLRMEKLGDGQLLVAEGEACADERDARTCVRGVRIVPVGRKRFVPLVLSDVDGRCLGRAFFPLRAEGTVGEGGRRKNYRVQSSVNFAPDQLSVQEQLTIGVGSMGSSSADAAASAVSRMTAERHIRFAAGRLIADSPSLLERWTKQERARASAGE
jgi:hypothetical protein